jgi:putative ABC transport system substrate-binding protein
MRRREFITLLGGAAVTWPLAGRAQQAMPVVGFLHPGSPGERLHLITALREGLRAHGYFEGQSVTIEYRWAEDQFDRLPSLAAELVRRRVTDHVGTCLCTAVLLAQ